MNNLSVSVVIPSFNREKLVMNAIESALSQDYDNLIEVIVVDDNSTDRTEDVVISRMRDDPRLKYIKNTKNLGGGGSRNKGIAAASGEIIAFLDSDDVWKKERLSSQINAFEDCMVVAAFCNYEMRQYETSELISTNSKAKNKPIDRIYTGNFLGSTSCLMARRETLCEIGMFDARLKSCQDWDIYIRLLQKGRYCYTEQILFTQYFHGKRLSGKKENIIQGLSLLISKMEGYCNEAGFSQKRKNKTLSDLYYRLGMYYCRYKDKRGAVNAFVQAQKLYLFNPRLCKLAINILKIRLES